MCVVVVFSIIMYEGNMTICSRASREQIVILPSHKGINCIMTLCLVNKL